MGRKIKQEAAAPVNRKPPLRVSKRGLWAGWRGGCGGDRRRGAAQVPDDAGGVPGGGEAGAGCKASEQFGEPTGPFRSPTARFRDLNAPFREVIVSFRSPPTRFRQEIVPFRHLDGRFRQSAGKLPQSSAKCGFPPGRMSKSSFSRMGCKLRDTQGAAITDREAREVGELAGSVPFIPSHTPFPYGRRATLESGY